jgi:hypothetical protein
MLVKGLTSCIHVVLEFGSAHFMCSSVLDPILMYGKTVHTSQFITPICVVRSSAVPRPGYATININRGKIIKCSLLDSLPNLKL